MYSSTPVVVSSPIPRMSRGRIGQMISPVMPSDDARGREHRQRMARARSVLALALPGRDRLPERVPGSAQLDDRLLADHVAVAAHDLVDRAHLLATAVHGETDAAVGLELGHEHVAVRAIRREGVEQTRHRPHHFGLVVDDGLLPDVFGGRGQEAEQLRIGIGLAHRRSSAHGGGRRRRTVPPPRRTRLRAGRRDRRRTWRATARTRRRPRPGRRARRGAVRGRRARPADGGPRTARPLRARPRSATCCGPGARARRGSAPCVGDGPRRRPPGWS